MTQPVAVREKKGRKTTVLYFWNCNQKILMEPSNCVFIDICICSASAASLHGMLFGRFLVGIGMGIGPPVASLYVTEV